MSRILMGFDFFVNGFFTVCYKRNPLLKTNMVSSSQREALKTLIELNNSPEIASTSADLGTVAERLLMWHVATRQSSRHVRSHRRLAKVVQQEIDLMSYGQVPTVDAIRNISCLLCKIGKRFKNAPRIWMALPYCVEMSLEFPERVWAVEFPLVLDYVRGTPAMSMHARDIYATIETSHYNFIKQSMWDFERYLSQVCEVGQRADAEHAEGLRQVCEYWRS
jgi:hypothetical protein